MAKPTFKEKLLNKPIVVKTIDNAKAVALPGFEGLTLYEVGYFFFVEMGKSSITTRSSAVAFKFFLAIFPAIIFLFSLIPHLPVADLHQQLLIQMKAVLPTNAYESGVETINDLVSNQHNGLLSFGFLVTLYFSTNGISALMEAFNQAMHAAETRSFIKERLISIFLFIVLSVLLLTASLLIIFSEVALDYMISRGLLISGSLEIILLTFGKWSVVLLLLFTAISLLYYFGPVNSKKYDLISPGAILATVLSIVASVLFSYYVNNFGTYNKVYGSIGTLMVVMLWLEFNCLIILIGFDLNAKIYNRV
ncbi:MAG: YihY/virulence factor BrkB family protein [Bacteroidia bacterium]|jgi:membrane protein